MIVVHLDDSGESQDPVVTLAGYVGTADGWAEFETRAGRYLGEAGIEYLHTVDLHQRRKQFDGWNSRETLEFAKGFFELVGACAPLGVEFSVAKSAFKTRKLELGMKREGSPLTFCLKGLLNNLMSNQGIKDSLALDGVELSFIVESGKRSEPMVKEFARIKESGFYGDRLRSLNLEDKKKLYALQAADFLAFFSRRLRCMRKTNPKFQADEDFFNDATRAVKVHSYFLATDFGHDPAIPLWPGPYGLS